MRHGVDLDGTLAEYHGFVAPDSIGRPVPRMAERVRRWLDAGDVVDVFTARVHPSHGEEVVSTARSAIEAWFREHFGTGAAVTCEKHPKWDDYWDDKAVQVVENSGERADGLDEAAETPTDGMGAFLCGHEG